MRLAAPPRNMQIPSVAASQLTFYARDGGLSLTLGFRTPKKSMMASPMNCRSSPHIEPRSTNLPQVLIEEASVLRFRRSVVSVNPRYPRRKSQLLALRGPRILFRPEYRLYSCGERYFESFEERDSSIWFFSVTSLLASSTRCFASRSFVSASLSSVTSVITVTVPPEATWRRPIL